MCHFISGTALSTDMNGSTWASRACRLGRAAGVRKLAASHVSERMDVPGVRERLIREMSAQYPGNLFFGEDLKELPIGAPAPAPLECNVSGATRDSRQSRGDSFAG
jgi:hypothetical protein